VVLQRGRGWVLLEKKKKKVQARPWAPEWEKRKGKNRMSKKPRKGEKERAVEAYGRKNLPPHGKRRGRGGGIAEK